MWFNGVFEECFWRVGDWKRSKGKLGDGSGGMDIMSSLWFEEEEEEWGGVESGIVCELVVMIFVFRMFVGVVRGYFLLLVVDIVCIGLFFM